MAWLTLYAILIGGVLLALAARIARAPQERRRAAAGRAPAPPPDLEGATPFVCAACGAFLISRTGPGVTAVRCTRCDRVVRVEPAPRPERRPERDRAPAGVIAGAQVAAPGRWDPRR